MNFTSVFNKISSFNDSNAPLKEEMLFFIYDEYKKFISEETELVYKCAFDILYYCGLRRGQLIGLNWNNVDINRMEIRVRDNSVRDFDNGGHLIIMPKTKKSIGNIPIRKEFMILMINVDFFGVLEIAGKNKGNYI